MCQGFLKTGQQRAGVIWNMIDEIINFLGPNNVIAVLLVWNILGAIYHHKWEKRVNKALFEE